MGNWLNINIFTIDKPTNPLEEPEKLCLNDKIMELSIALEKATKNENESANEEPSNPVTQKKESKRQKIEQSKGKSVAQKLLMYTTRTGFNEIREELINIFKMEDYDVPTFIML